MDRALPRFTLAAEQGSASAQFELGRVYAEGRNAPQDHMIAHHWLNLAAYRSSGAEKDDAVKLRNAVAAALPPEHRGSGAAGPRMGAENMARAVRA
jgi:TPR repeat protein